MRIYFVSDMHFSHKRRESYDVFENVLQEADLVIVGGDWDFIPYSPEELNDLRGDTEIISIYGNHDDVDVLKSYHNQGVLYFLEDGDYVIRDGLSICGLGGAVVRDDYGFPGTWHTPEYYFQKYLELREKMFEVSIGQLKGDELQFRRTPEYYIKKYLELNQKLSSGLVHCDILVTHESPQQNVVDSVMECGDGVSVNNKSYKILFDTVATLLAPKVYFSGHIHIRIPTISVIRNYDIYSQNVPDKTYSVRVTTLEGAYAMYDTDEHSITTFLGNKEIERVTIL